MGLCILLFFKFLIFILVIHRWKINICRSSKTLFLIISKQVRQKLLKTSHISAGVELSPKGIQELGQLSICGSLTNTSRRYPLSKKHFTLLNICQKKTNICLLLIWKIHIINFSYIGHFPSLTNFVSRILFMRQQAYRLDYLIAH